MASLFLVKSDTIRNACALNLHLGNHNVNDLFLKFVSSSHTLITGLKICLKGLDKNCREIFDLAVSW